MVPSPTGLYQDACNVQNSYDRRNSNGGTTPPDGACATCHTNRQLSKHAVHTHVEEAKPCRVMLYPLLNVHSSTDSSSSKHTPEPA
jgi:hypothetical protein